MHLAPIQQQHAATPKKAAINTPTSSIVSSITDDLNSRGLAGWTDVPKTERLAGEETVWTQLGLWADITVLASIDEEGLKRYIRTLAR
jgi:hypothetical protein